MTPEKTKNLANAGLIPGRLTGIKHATDLPLRLHTWDSRHPIFAPFSDPQLGDLQRHVNRRREKKYRGRQLSPVTLKKV